MDRIWKSLARPDSLWRKFARRWQRHGHTDNAAALAFYSLVSLVPVLMIGVLVAGLVLGERAAHGELEKQLAAVVGDDAARFLEQILQSARINPGSGPVAFAFILVVLFYSGSHVLSKLRETLNLINEVEPLDPARPWLARLIARGLCAALLLVFGILLVVGTVLEGFIGSFADQIDTRWIEKFSPLQGYQWISTYLLLALAFLFILKVLPRRRPGWRPAALGAVLSALAVGSLKSGLDLYLRHSPLASIFGTGLTVLVFLFWLFLSIQAFLAGAELTAVLMRRRESVPPK
jgi:membrane protein